MSQQKRNPLAVKSKTPVLQSSKQPVNNKKGSNLPQSRSTKDLAVAATQPQIQSSSANNGAVASINSLDGAAKSIYVQKENQDEWATILKYDAQLYKKEQQIEKEKERNQKRKMKEELDRQIKERNRVRAAEEADMKKYSEFIGQQVKVLDSNEKKKEQEMKDSVLRQKMSRDQQLREENARRKQVKKVQEETEQVLVKRIQEEIDSGIRNAALKRQQEKENLKKVLVENAQRKKVALEQAKKNKEADTKAQQEYSKLIEKQEATRNAEVKSREEKTRKFMDLMADTVVKDHKAQALAEEKRFLKHVMEKEAREAEEEKKKQQKENEQKQEMKKFLEQQVKEKQRKTQEESLLGKKQAEVWKTEVKEFSEHEKQKGSFVKDVNMKNADFLKHQMSDKKRQQKMNEQELLYNKPILKEIADKDAQAQFEKQVIKQRNVIV